MKYKKILLTVLLLLMASLPLSAYSCDTALPEADSGATGQDEAAGFAYDGMDSQSYASFEEFLASCKVANIHALLAEFPRDSFTELEYYTTYYMYDYDHNFPIWVIAFTAEGQQYYFSGAERNDVFTAADYQSQVYSGSRLASQVQLSSVEGGVNTCRMVLQPDYEEFSLSARKALSSDAYLELLSLITNDSYRYSSDGVTAIEGNTVYLHYISYDLASGDYALSADGLLRESEYHFEPSTQEVKIFTSDEEEAGADLITNPASLQLDFEIVGNGRVTIAIPSADAPFYRVTIATDTAGQSYIVDSE